MQMETQLDLNFSITKIAMLTRLEKKKHLKVIEWVTNTSIQIRSGCGCVRQRVDSEIITCFELEESMNL